MPSSRASAEGLGVDEPIDAEFYKLLIYDRGSFFVGHRDTEKAPGMFATLVIVLPSLSSGGELLVRHAGREIRLDLRCEDPSEAAFAAFYADCVHEVLPVTDGCRLTLVYNLLRRDRGRKLEPPSYDAETARLAALLRKWGDGKTMPTGAEPSDGDTPEKLVYPLEHAYTQAELGFAALKGADAAVAGVLAAAAPQADCELHLALLEVEESGMAEYSGDYRRGRGWRDSDDDDEFEAGEVSDRSVSLSEWRKPDGDTSALGNLPVEEEAELSPPDAFADLEPDEEHFQEATGNAGATFERTYRRAALVLWPRRRRLAVVCQAGLSATLPLLEDTLQRADAATGDQREALRAEALELAGHMVEQWPAGTVVPALGGRAGPGRAHADAACPAWRSARHRGVRRPGDRGRRLRSRRQRGAADGAGMSAAEAAIGAACPDRREVRRRRVRPVCRSACPRGRPVARYRCRGEAVGRGDARRSGKGGAGAGMAPRVDGAGACRRSFERARGDRPDAGRTRRRPHSGLAQDLRSGPRAGSGTAGLETHRCCDRAIACGVPRPSARPRRRAAGASGGLAACEPGVLQVRTLHGVEQISR